MNMLLKLGAAACLFAAAVQAQHLTVLSAMHILDTTGALGNGTLCFIPSASPYTPSGVAPQSGNTCYTVTAGMISGASLYDAAYITPQGFSYTYQFTQTSGSVVVLTIPSIQVTGTLFNLDTYAVPSAIRASGNGAPNVNCQAGARFVQLDAPTTLNTWACVGLNGVTKWYLDPTQVSGNPAGTGLSSPGTDNVLLAYSNGLLTRAATFADILPIISGTPSSLTFINGLGQWATPAGAGNVSTSGSMASGNVPKSTGVTTLTDGGQAYPGSAFVGRTDSQALTHKDLTDPTNVFPTLNQNTTGFAATAGLASQANILSTTPSLCNVGWAPIGVLNSGWVTGCEPTEACFSILAFGGSPNGTTSNNAAWTALLASSRADQVCAYFPPGVYAFATPPIWTAPSANSSITIRGDGGDVSKLLFASGQNGIVLNLAATSNAVNVTGLSFLTQSTGGVSGLVVNNTGAAMAENVMSNITNNAFYGADCKACTNYWANSILLHSDIAYNVNFNKFVGTSGTPNGNAIFIDKTTAAIPVLFNVIGNTFDYSGTCLTIGDFVQGVTVGYNNFTGVGNGVFVPSGHTYGNNDELFIGPGNQFNATVAGIDVESPYRHTNVFDNYFVVGTAANAMVFNNYAMTTVSGNHLINVGGGSNGIVFEAYADDASLVYGNQTQFFTTGLWLQTASAHTMAFGNVGTGNVNDVVNTGTGNAVGLAAFTGTPTSSFQVVNGVVIHQ